MRTVYTYRRTMTSPKNVLSVRLKILLTIVISICVLGAAIFIISSLVLLKSYRDIEDESMAQNLRRATDAITEFEGQQLIKLSDWAAWDQAYDYARTRDPKWAAETVYATGLANLDINALMFSDLDAKIITLMTVDIEERAEVPSTDVTQYFAAHPDLVSFNDLEGQTEGIAMLPHGPLIIVSLPLRTSEGKGPSTGAITFARYLDEGKIADFSEITHLTIDIFSYGSATLPADVSSAKTKLDGGDANVIVPQSDTMLEGYTLVRDVYGAPALILRVETPRPIYAQGRLTLYVYLLSGAVALLLFGIVITWALDRLVIARFERLSRDVEKVNEAHDLSMKLAGGEPDEIGRLAERINQMLAWLKESREGEAASRREIVNLLNDLKQEKEQTREMAEVLKIKKNDAQ